MSRAQAGLILTEGKTDWMHLKRANHVLEICPNLEFRDADDPRGDQELLKQCKTHAQLTHDTPIICVFDRDNKSVLKEVTDGDAPYKTWGNNVFSFALPVPTFRHDLAALSIEFLYSDADLLRLDQHGRRLFLTSEFDDKSGNHKANPTLHVGNVHRIRNFAKIAKIVDADIGVFNAKDENVALSKADFAHYVLTTTPPFHLVDFSGFRAVFLIIRSILSAAASAPRREILTPEVTTKAVAVAVRRADGSTPHDNPPHIPVFVGRESHLRTLDNEQIRVAAITGLGGEGKSTLASRFYSLARRGLTTIPFTRFGWCDCKELESSFHDRLLLLIDELSGGNEPRDQYADENIHATLARFIALLQRDDCLVVFDNVDAFVDKDSSGFIDVLRIMFDTLTTQLSKSLVLFTCRPAIHDYRASFLEIPVAGLSFDEARELSAHLHLQIPDNVLQHICERTQGHALWLNLIFGQLRSGRITPNAVQALLAAPSSTVSDLNVRLLQSIWATLSTREKEVLTVIGIFTRPQGIGHIERASHLSYQRCVRLLRTLVSMRLVLEVEVSGVPHYDLHPIIRAKVRIACGPIRMRALTARALAALVPIGFPGLANLVRTESVSRPSIEAYIESAEIAVENGAVREGIERLGDLAKHLWRVGEEPKFVDLTKRLLDTLQPGDPRIGANESLTDVFAAFIEVLLQQDDAATADKYLRRLEDSMESIAEVIQWATQRGYYLWFVNDYRTAVDFMEARMRQIKEKGEEIPDTLRYNYGLALRDSGRVDEAITIFAKGRDLATLEAAEPGSSDESSADLGNIGRCFYLKGDYAKGLAFIKKSADVLRQNQDTRTDKVNYGYALLWLADTYVMMGEYKEAVVALQQVVGTWSVYAPARLAKARKHVGAYPEAFQRYALAQAHGTWKVIL